MDDPLRDALSAAYDKVEESAPEPVAESVQEEAAPVEQEQTAAERARDEQGRFAKAEEAKEKRQTLTLKEKPNAAPKPERKTEGEGAGKEVAPGAGQPAAQANGDPGGSKDARNDAGNSQPILPPQHWNGRGKIEFERLPYHVKQTLVEEYNSVAELRGLAPVLEPVKQVLSQEFGGVDRGIGAILSTWNFARTQPIDFARQFLQRYNIDPQTLVGVASGAQPEGDEAPQYITRQELAAIQARERQEAETRAAAQKIQTDISSFGSSTNPDGSLTYPYFNDVRSIMAGIMQAGAAKTLQEAYERAVYADPGIRASLLAADQAKQAAERRRQADQARGAAVSVTGAPGHRGPGAPSNETVDATLHRAWEKAVSGARA